MLQRTCATCRHYRMTLGPIIELGRFTAPYSVGLCSVAQPRGTESRKTCDLHASRPAESPSKQ